MTSRSTAIRLAKRGRVLVGYISQWQPTEEERAAIAAGGPVWVSVWSQGGPPPIAVFGVTPFLRPEVRFSEQPPEQPAPTDQEIESFFRGLEASDGAEPWDESPR